MNDSVLRAATVADIPMIGALARVIDAYDRVPVVLTDEELAQDFAASHVAVALDTRVAVQDGSLVGWLIVWNPPQESRLDRAELFGGVAPDRRGTGIGSALLDWAVARARERFASRDNDLPRYIRIHAYDWLEDRHRLFRRFGFDAVRWSDELIRALDDLPTVPSPERVTLVPWPDDRDDELRQVRNAAFADHWGSAVLDTETWHGYIHGHGSRLDLSVIAVDDESGRAIGLCSNAAFPEDEQVTGRKDAWIANVATLREARGRGVASAMIASSLAAFATAGFTHALLGVDTDNPTGAARLYRNLGFEPNHRGITFQLEGEP